MEVTRERFEREGCYNFYLEDNDKVLSIIFGGNLDLYWSLSLRNKKINQDNILDEDIQKLMHGELKSTFTITKENYFIYSLFEDIYEDIKNARIYEREIKKSNDEELSILDENCSIDDTDDIGVPLRIMTEEEIEKRNNEFKERYFYKLLFDGEKIEWHSDEENYDIANRVVIRKINDNFVLEFTRPEMTKDKYLYYSAPGSISIRFRNSGSLYDPFNIIFMRMFNHFQEYDPEYHQIHLEEMSYQRRILKK